ncbi:MAG: hypothetical protein ACK58T_04430, partial [Phycisphaerae bacterium]
RILIYCRGSGEKREQITLSGTDGAELTAGCAFCRENAHLAVKSFFFLHSRVKRWVRKGL